MDIDKEIGLRRHPELRLPEIDRTSVLADQPGVQGCPSAAFDQRRLARRVENMFLTPLHQRNQRQSEINALGGQHILMTRTLAVFLVRALAQEIILDKFF